MHQRVLGKQFTREKSFCLIGAAGVGKYGIIREFAGSFSNSIHCDLETTEDRNIFCQGASYEETLRALSFLKGKEIRGKGTLIMLAEIGMCPVAIEWASKHLAGSNRRPADRPVVAATSSFMTKELETLCHGSRDDTMVLYHVLPFSFEEFLMAMDDPAALEAFREVPVPYYAYEKLLDYFHLYSLIGGMPEIVSEYAANRYLSGLKKTYEKIGDKFVQGLPHVTSGPKSREMAREVLQNSFPYAATRISFSRFGNLEKGSREIRQAFQALEQNFLLKLAYPVSSTLLPLAPDTSRFPRLQMVDTGLVNYFSGIQKPLFRSHDMNAIFAGQIARQAVGQEILVTNAQRGPDNGHTISSAGYSGPELHFWVRKKAQSTAEVDFVIPYNDLLIPVVVRSGEPGRLRSLHQFVDQALHPFAVRLHAEKLSVQQTRTIRGKKFYLLNLPYFLAGKIREHLGGFMRLAEGETMGR